MIIIDDNNEKIANILIVKICIYDCTSKHMQYCLNFPRFPQLFALSFSPVSAGIATAGRPSHRPTGAFAAATCSRSFTSSNPNGSGRLSLDVILERDYW